MVLASSVCICRMPAGSFASRSTAPGGMVDSSWPAPMTACCEEPDLGESSDRSRWAMVCSPEREMSSSHLWFPDRTAGAGLSGSPSPCAIPVQAPPIAAHSSHNSRGKTGELSGSSELLGRGEGPASYSCRSRGERPPSRRIGDSSLVLLPLESENLLRLNAGADDTIDLSVYATIRR